MQRINDNVCPRCHIPLIETLLENRAASWSLNCQQCGFQKFKCYCPKCNSCLETTNALQIADGFRLTCPSPICQNKFQVIKCPLPSCKKFNFFNNGSYSMGELVRCKSCQTPFQQLTCPHCLESNYWRGDVDNFYAAGNVTQCYACQRKFQHIQCPHCKQPKYFQNCEYIGGIKQTCDFCTKSFQHTLCSNCHTPNYYPQCSFKYGTKQTCSNSQCKQDFELVICPDCAKENLFKEGLNQTTHLKDYNCWNCKNKFAHCLCKFCQESIYTKTDSDFREGSNTIPCPSCKKNIPDFYKCGTCKRVLIDSKGCRSCPIVVPVARPQVGLFSSLNNNNNTTFENNNRAPNNIAPSSIFSSGNAVPSSIFNVFPTQSLYDRSGNNQNNRPPTSSLFGGLLADTRPPNPALRHIQNTYKSTPPENMKTSTKDQPVEKSEPENLEEGKTCVICFSHPSEIAFIPCGHKKTCNECSNRIMQSNKACPICRKPIQSIIKIFE